MYCSRCGTKLDANAKYCNKCGFNMSGSNVVTPPPYINNINSNISKSKESNKKMIFMGIGIGTSIVLLILLFNVIIQNSKSDYYFSDNSYTNTDVTNSNSTRAKENTTTTKKSKSKTVIISDNFYKGVSVSSIDDAEELISKDSTDQKSKCPSEILEVENDIIKKYGITAVNLCEMDVDFAKELGNVFGVIYDEYPAARGHLTNVTLRNTSMMSESGVIAAFMPIFSFATSNTQTTYPWVIKTQMLLSSPYFLNKNKLEGSVKDGSSSGHFPPNSTIYSPVAHELGHYLSFLAMLNNYDMNSVLLIDANNIDTLYKVYEDFGKGYFSLKMLQEAYNNYKSDTNTTLSFDEWRGTISGYALAKDNDGEYIYDETIAEAFHDTYLNKDNARDASKYIIKVLKKYLENR